MKKLAIGEIILVFVCILILIITTLGGFKALLSSPTGLSTFAFFSKLTILILVSSLSLFFIFILITNEEKLILAYASLFVVLLCFCLGLALKTSSGTFYNVVNFFNNVRTILTIEMFVFSIKSQSSIHKKYKDILSIIVFISMFFLIFSKESTAAFSIFMPKDGLSSFSRIINTILLYISISGILLNPVIGYLTKDDGYYKEPISQKAFEQFQITKTNNVVPQQPIETLNQPVSTTNPTVTTNTNPQPTPVVNQTPQFINNQPQNNPTAIQTTVPTTQPTPVPNTTTPNANINQPRCDLNVNNVSPQLAFLLEQDDSSSNNNQ